MTSLVDAEGLLISLRHDLPWLPVVGNLARNRVSTEGSAEKKDVRLGPAPSFGVVEACSGWRVAATGGPPPRWFSQKPCRLPMVIGRSAMTFAAVQRDFFGLGGSAIQ